MARVQAEDREALAELYDRFIARALGVSMSVCRDRGRAEDAVQEAFISIWRNRAVYEPDRGTVAAWLMTIVRHRAIGVARHDDRHAARRVAEDRLDTRRGPHDVLEDAAHRARAACLQDLLARLPDAQREVIALAFYAQLTHVEIAQHLDLPPGTVKGRMRLGLEKLRRSAGDQALA